MLKAMLAQRQRRIMRLMSPQLRVCLEASCLHSGEHIVTPSQGGQAILALCHGSASHTCSMPRVRGKQRVPHTIRRVQVQMARASCLRIWQTWRPSVPPIISNSRAVCCLCPPSGLKQLHMHKGSVGPCFGTRLVL